VNTMAGDAAQRRRLALAEAASRRCSFRARLRDERR
jgi:hypothetical protein